MESNEISSEMSMNYQELVEHLLKKYGKAKYDYYLTTECRTRNKKLSRTAEGLFCHHIDEDKYYFLSDPNFARSAPFECQKAERLVYCNHIEHLLLHIQIGKDLYWEKHTSLESIDQLQCFITPGVIFVCHDVNELFNQNGSQVPWIANCYHAIENNFDDYIKIIKAFIGYLDEHYSGSKQIRNLYVGQKFHNKILGEGIVTELRTEGILTIATVQYEKAIKYVSSDPYYRAIDNIRKKLSSNRNSECIQCVYDALLK